MLDGPLEMVRDPKDSLNSMRREFIWLVNTVCISARPPVILNREQGLLGIGPTTVG